MARWAVQAVAKAGSIGGYPPGFSAFPLGEAMNKKLTIQVGNCPHRRYGPELLSMVARGGFITQRSQPESMDKAYKDFDSRHDGW